jgi:hypothetical protein
MSAPRMEVPTTVGRAYDGSCAEQVLGFRVQTDFPVTLVVAEYLLAIVRRSSGSYRPSPPAS